jgi:hypothetical protein
VNFRVGGYETIKGAKKMRGGSNTVAEGTPDYAPTPAAFIFSHIKGLTLDGITLTWPDADPATPAPARHALYGDRLDGVALTGFRASASLPGLKPIVLENSLHVHP